MINYFKILFNALLGKPIIITRVDVVHIPFNKEQINYLEKIFPTPVWAPDTDIEQMAYYTGKSDVVKFIKNWSANGGKYV